jgi:transcriptional regulator with PAS, ATPase and Fis domain
MRPTLDRIAASDLPVLLLGETGSGKEVLADLVHRRSARAAGPFLRLNCASVPEALLEGELFGYQRGAFTGALAAKPGLLELASGGTAFLDEIGELAPAAQAKLLRAIGEGRLLRLGDDRERPIDVRYVAATNRDPSADVARKRFRSDLLYRLNAFTVRVPPLRERPDEIEPLARFFAARIAARLGRPVPILSGDALALLHHHRWPGNVRELRHAIEHAVVLADGVIEAGHLPWPIGCLPLEHSRRPRAGRAEVVEALARTKGNQTKAARLLGVSRQTLIARIRLYRLPRPRLGAIEEEG